MKRRALREAALTQFAVELIRRGWFVTAIETGARTALIGFNFLPNRRPSWLKAFEVPLDELTVGAVERRIEDWKASVRHGLALGRTSWTVRRMLAEHGPDRVEEAMRAREPAE
jgi:hypothetical protein